MKNRYEVRGDTTAVFITRKGVVYEVLIDTDILPRLQTIKSAWSINAPNHTNYAKCHTVNNEGIRKTITMHRFLMGFPEGKIIDHINGNGLDNRLSNLRIVDHKVNNNNQHRLKSNNKSGFKGVSWCKYYKKWAVYITVNSKNKFVGKFDNIEDAKRAYDQAAKKNPTC